MKRFLIILSIVGLLVGIGVWLAPLFLRYSTPPIETKTVVLFLGPGWEARKRQADDLLGACPGEVLIIPALGSITASISARPPLQRTRLSDEPGQYPVHFEDTHIEVLTAKVMMDANRITSANFVSSPYHMRRIKLIADREFDPVVYRLAFVPTTYEPPIHPLWVFNATDLRWVFSEYAKILWFLLYEPFT